VEQVFEMGLDAKDKSSLADWWACGVPMRMHRSSCTWHITC
jgi:hypothetical protein